MKKQLNETERPILACLWENSPRSMAEIWHAVEAETGWSKSTVNTLLGRMVKKGLLLVTMGRRGKEYAPAFGREAAAYYETSSLLDRVYQGSVGMMLTTLVENEALTREDIAELYAILQKAEEAAK
ncbi:MAG: BlaI/MecI/CopY family transcriptional regulator [bacterium]